ncbi:E3 SUMO-protein ligase ZBED1-like [Erpetoichthys calabaricus]|uniref:E3 SUMO-protein ligase ZBED1-like n=1 Tax=Erpetoichthys calabaricus TaxID=27687 RepID=UPI002233F232|nr:E3 SUMO-protein ligase ZBED1-like [Erpetoichthys calabaricus]
MARHHPEDANEVQPKVKNIPGDQCTLHQCCKLPTNSERAKKITQSIACFISKDLRPYSVVENEGFRYMLKTVEPRYAIPSRRLFAEKAIPLLYEETKKKVAEALKKATRVALICDAWTSRAVQSYVTFTAHYIRDNWELELRVLQTTAINESHTAAHIKENIQSVAQEWQLTTTDLAIVIDNAANMLVAAQLGNFQHVKCFAHNISLAAQRALKLLSASRLLGKIRRITGFFHRSATANHVFKQKQKLLELAPHKLTTDVATRWNSALDMIDRFLEQQPAICAALLSAEVRKCGAGICTLDEIDVANAEEVAAALKPLKEATNIMSEEATPTLSVIAPLHAQLLHETKAGFCGETALVQEIKQAIHEDLAKRYTSVTEKNMLHISSSLDPRFKTLPFLSQDEQKDIHSKVIAEAAALENEEPDIRNEVLDDEGPPVPKKRNTSLLNLLGKTFTNVRVVPKSAGTRAEEEMKKYLETPSLSLSEDPLNWWRSQDTVFALLAKLAQCYLCIPGTSVAAERVFSTAGDIVTAQRSMLTPEHVDQLLFLQKNMYIPADGGL